MPGYPCCFSKKVNCRTLKPFRSRGGAQINFTGSVMDNLSSLLTAPNEGTVLAPSITFKGVMEINGPESITINGTFEGEIVAAAGTVFIGASGVMRGSVKAAKLIVAGTVEPLNDADLIEATEYLAIAKDGFLTSNEVVYGKIAMEMGAVVQAGM